MLPRRVACGFAVCVSSTLVQTGQKDRASGYEWLVRVNYTVEVAVESNQYSPEP